MSDDDIVDLHMERGFYEDEEPTEVDIFLDENEEDVEKVDLTFADGVKAEDFWNDFHDDLDTAKILIGLHGKETPGPDVR